MKKKYLYLSHDSYQNRFFSFLLFIGVFSLCQYYFDLPNTPEEELVSSNLSPSEIDLGDDVLICPGDSYQLDAILGSQIVDYDFDSITWSHPDILNNPGSLNPIATPSATVDLTVSVLVTEFENLVKNGDFNEGTDGIETELSYELPIEGCLDPENYDTIRGRYTIGIDPELAFDEMDSCPAVGEDDDNYNMMITNANEAADFEILWEQEITGLLPGADYDFSASLLNLKDKNITSVQFIKDHSSTPIISMDTLLQEGCSWTEYRFSFNSGMEESVYISIVNIDGQEKGDDIGIDHISLRRDTSIVSDTITIEVAEPVDANLSSIPSCYGKENGVIIVDSISGKPPFRFHWSHTSLDSDTLVGLSPGNYTVVIEDSFTCQVLKSIIVEEYPPMQISFEVEDVLCNGGNDGRIYLDAFAQGCSNLKYEWNSADSIPVISTLESGQYIVTITDCNDCSEVDSVFVPQPDVVQIVYFVEPPTCNGYLDAIIIIDTILGGTQGFKISKDSNHVESIVSFPFVISDIGAGVFNFTLRDEHDCITYESIDIPSPEEVIVDLGDDINVMLGESVQMAPVLFGNIETLIWEGGGDSVISCISCPDPFIMPNQNSTFTLTVIDSFGCTATDNINLTLDVPYSIFIPNVFTPNGDNINDFVTVFAGPDVRKVKSMKIFNRWGGLMFEAHDFLPNVPELGWNGMFKGRQLNNAVFVCIAEIEYINDAIIIKNQAITLLKN